MAFKRINAISFMADSMDDLKDLPVSKMGAECFVIENGKEYKCNSRGEWVDPKNPPAHDPSSTGLKRINAISFMVDDVENLKDLPESKMGSGCHCIANDTDYICNSKGEWIAQPSSTLDLETPDWNEVDPESNAYIKNKTHYISEDPLFSGNLSSWESHTVGVFAAEYPYRSAISIFNATVGSNLAIMWKFRNDFGVFQIDVPVGSVSTAQQEEIMSKAFQLSNGISCFFHAEYIGAARLHLYANAKFIDEPITIWISTDPAFKSTTTAGTNVSPGQTFVLSKYLSSFSRIKIGGESYTFGILNDDNIIKATIEDEEKKLFQWMPDSLQIRNISGKSLNIVSIDSFASCKTIPTYYLPDNLVYNEQNKIALQTPKYGSKGQALQIINSNPNGTIATYGWADPWIITAEDGTQFKIIVSSDGTLSTTPI